MIVFKSKYDKLRREYEYLELKYNQRLQSWNRLVERINNKGGEEFLVHGEIPRKSQPNKPQKQLDDAMIQRLLRLCHPDKHNNSETSNEVTKWLLSQRK